MTIPDDLQAAIDVEPRAVEMLAKLNAQNRFALAFRVRSFANRLAAATRA